MTKKYQITWYWCQNIRENMVEKRVKKFGQGTPPIPFRAVAKRKFFFTGGLPYVSFFHRLSWPQLGFIWLRTASAGAIWRLPWCAKHTLPQRSCPGCSIALVRVIQFLSRCLRSNAGRSQRRSALKCHIKYRGRFPTKSVLMFHTRNVMEFLKRWRRRSQERFHIR